MPYLNKESQGDDAKVSITNAQGKVVKDVILP